MYPNFLGHPSSFPLPWWWEKVRKGNFRSLFPIASMGRTVYLPTWMVDFYGFHVGKYTSPMDGMGLVFLVICLKHRISPPYFPPKKSPYRWKPPHPWLITEKNHHRWLSSKLNKEVQLQKKKVHPWKLTCPQKRDYFSREYIFQPLIFRGHVSFQGSNARIDQLKINVLHKNIWIFQSRISFQRCIVICR